MAKKLSKSQINREKNCVCEMFGVCTYNRDRNLRTRTEEVGREKIGGHSVYAGNRRARPFRTEIKKATSGWLHMFPKN